MFQIKKTFRFEAAHKLDEHDGKCARLHGHSYELTVEISSPHLFQIGAKKGMVTDFSEVSEFMKPLLEDFLDHHYLNETLGIYPTAELIAQWIYSQLEKAKFKGGFVTAVEIGETCTASARYCK